MIIKLCPEFSDGVLSVNKSGDVLTIDGEQFDFRDLPEGAVLPSSAVDSSFVVGDITRKNGDLIITLRLPHAQDAPEATRYPADIVNPPDGNVRFPQ